MIKTTPIQADPNSATHLARLKLQCGNKGSSVLQFSSSRAKLWSSTTLLCSLTRLELNYSAVTNSKLNLEARLQNHPVHTRECQTTNPQHFTSTRAKLPQKRLSMCISQSESTGRVGRGTIYHGHYLARVELNLTLSSERLARVELNMKNSQEGSTEFSSTQIKSYQE